MYVCSGVFLQTPAAVGTMPLLTATTYFFFYLGSFLSHDCSAAPSLSCGRCFAMSYICSRWCLYIHDSTQVRYMKPACTHCWFTTWFVVFSNHNLRLARLWWEQLANMSRIFTFLLLVSPRPFSSQWLHGPPDSRSPLSFLLSTLRTPPGITVEVNLLRT